MRLSFCGGLFALAVSMLGFAQGALAQTPARGLPVSVIAEALADPQPTAFSPADFSVADFSVERAPGSAPEIAAELEAGSLEWVRTAAFVVVPRAVLVVTAKGAERGSVTYAGASHPLVRASQGDVAARALVPLALIDGAAHPIEVRAFAGGAQGRATFVVRFSPRTSQRGRVMFDTRCSPYGVNVGRGALPADAFLYVGCNSVVTQRGDHDSATLDLYLLWDRARAVAINGVDVAPRAESLYVHRVSGGPGSTTVSADRSPIELRYQLPEPMRAGFLGIGLGPYYYSLEDDRIQHEAGAAMLTLYGGYVVNPTMRIVYFNAAVLERRGYMDQGVYLWIEQARFLDERLSLNLLLGANALVYSRHDDWIGRLSAPQGFEIVFRDFLARNRNVTAGAFLYPSIGDRSYYNVWLRWGSPSFFGELNYIGWEEPHPTGASKSHSLGISFGTPLVRFLRFL